MKRTRRRSKPVTSPVAPLAGAWIETCRKRPRGFGWKVAPLAGAWIETLMTRSFYIRITVAPLAGAWIETYTPYHLSPCSRSHPSRVRGLKLIGGLWFLSSIESHPSRVRGLKQTPLPSSLWPMASHPSRVRGLKQDLRYYLPFALHVAPLAGAWIETRLCACCG